MDFGGSACTITGQTGTTVNCNTTTHAAGLVDITITNTDAQTGTLTSGYTYQAAPTVSSVAFDKGALAGGTNIVITGTGFITGLTVVLDAGGVPAICSVTASTSTTIDCTTSIHDAGAVTITVTNLDTQNITSGGIYEYRAAPIVTDLSITNGPANGGTTTLINGSGFLGFTSVTFGGATCVGATSNGAGTQITCTSTPAHAAGAVTVLVTSDDTQTGSLSSAFDYRPAPVITSIDYPKGPSGGAGVLVHIYGSHFVSAPTVDFSGTNCGAVSFIDSGHITCTTSNHAAGIVDVNLTNPDSQVATLVGGYEYQDSPTVATISPNGGSVAGGTAVTVTGTNFFMGITVDIGGSNCFSVTVISSTELSCTTLTHVAGAANVSVLNLDTQTGTQAGLYSYQAAPTVTTVSPSAGALAGGTTITITGTDFHLLIDGTTVVDLDGANCGTVIVASTTSLTCVTTAHIAGVVNVKVTNPDIQNSTLTSGYTYQVGPAITSITPNIGALAGGNTIAIIGTGFEAGTIVKIDGVDCTAVLFTDVNNISCVVPGAGAGVAAVLITNLDGQNTSLAAGYTYSAAPTITSVAYSTGTIDGNSAVTLTGTFFVDGSSINFDGSPCTSVTFVDSEHLTCNTPAHALGLVDVVVTNPDGQFVDSSNAYEYIPAPTGTSIDVITGVAVGGTAVIFTGTNFVTGVVASFGGSACTPLVFTDSTTFSCTTTVHASGLVDIIITNPDSQTVTMSSTFTYVGAPVITSISPIIGAATIGTIVTLTGINFEATTTVALDGVACTGVVYISATTISCTTGDHLAGVVDIVATNIDTQTGTLFTGFTYTDAPAVTSIDNAFGPSLGGTIIIITGTNFITGATASFGGNNCTSLDVDSATQITCTTIAGSAGLVDVVVTNTDTQIGTGTDLYTYQDAPIFTSIDKPAGALAGLTVIEITGDNFAAGAITTIDGSTCTGPVITATTITCTLPGPKVAGAMDLTITNLDAQTVTATGAYTYQEAPTVSSTSPGSGSNAGGDTITINGANFITGLTATIGGVACTSPTYISPTSMTCISGAHAVGIVPVVISNTDLQTGTHATAFLYAYPPNVTSISPALGSISGSTSITITGTNFSGPSTVNLGGTACTGVTVVSATSITCTTASSGAGVYDVEVTNADGQVHALPAAYTYEAIAILEWQGGLSYDYGTSSVNISNTFTLKNIGDISTTVITTAKSGAGIAVFGIGSDTCNTTILAAGASCTLTITFLGGIGGVGVYNASLDASAATGGTSSITLDGEIIP